MREIPGCRCAASDAWECGRDVYIEKQENRSADRNALGERMGGDNLDNLGQLFQGAPPERAAGEKRMGLREGGPDLERLRGDETGGTCLPATGCWADL